MNSPTQEASEAAEEFMKNYYPCSENLELIGKEGFLAGAQWLFNKLTKAPEGFDYKVWKPSEIAKLVNDISTAFISLNDHKAALASLTAQKMELEERLKDLDDAYKDQLQRNFNIVTDNEFLKQQFAEKDLIINKLTQSKGE